MPEFQMPFRDEKDQIKFKQLDHFTQGYIEAMFFTEEEQFGDVTFSDLSIHALDIIRKDCDRFQNDNKSTLEDERIPTYSDQRLGNDFWYTRNGHGVNYLFRNELPYDVAKKLYHAARLFSEQTAYVGDDGLIYLD